MKKIKILFIISLICSLFVFVGAFVACTSDSNNDNGQSNNQINNPNSGTPKSDLSFLGMQQNTVYMVSAENRNMSGELVIPATYNGKPVTEIFDFRSCVNLTSVVISEGITKISINAFNGCTNLKTIVIPESVKDIYSLAFKDCTSLTITYTGTSEQWEKVWKSSDAIPSYVNISFEGK